MALAERLANLRSELFGERGGPEMARRLGIPVRTWYNYEAGVTVPAEVILKIIELTSIEPSWLLHGKGSKFRQGVLERRETGTTPTITVGALLREALQLLEGQGSAGHRPSAEEDESLSGSPGARDGAVGGEGPPQEAGDDLSPEDGVEPRSTRGAVPGSDAWLEWLSAAREGRCLDIVGDAMAPVVADGASVAYSTQEETADQLHNKLVVVWHEGQPMVRWFQNCGRYALLRAENPDAKPPQTLIDLEDHDQPVRFRRVLWINTPH